MDVKDRVIRKIGLIDDALFLADLEIIIANLQDGGNEVYKLTEVVYKTAHFFA